MRRAMAIAALLPALAFGQVFGGGTFSGGSSAGGSAMAMPVNAFGDSITADAMLAYGPTPYPTRLQTLLGSGYVVVNLGLPGDTTTNAVTRWRTLGKARGYKRMALLIGTNDLTLATETNRTNGTAALLAFTNIQTIVSEALADGQLVALCTIMPRAGWAGHTAALQSALVDLNDRIRAYAASTSGVALVDLYALLGSVSDPTKMAAIDDYGDGIHTTQHGMDFIADAVHAALPR